MRDDEKYNSKWQYFNMAIKLKLFSVFIFAASLNAVELTEALIMDMSRTYGYVTAQTLVAEKLKEKYPEIKLNITKAQLEFDLKFKSSMENIKKSFGKELQKYEEIVNSNLIAEIDAINLDLSYKNGFANQILARSKGAIESPVIETLLIFNPTYQKYPIQEFSDGFKKRLYSKDTTKSKGVDFHIDIPQSWKVKDGKRPNILWISYGNNGYIDHGGNSVGFNVMIKELDENIDISSQKETQEFCNKAFKESTLKECVKITLEGLPALYARDNMTIERLKTRVTMEVANYFIFFNNKMIILQGIASTNNNQLSQSELNEKFDNYLPLFDQIANSFVINDLYIEEQVNSNKFYTYSLFNNSFQAVFPGEPTIQEIPIEQIDPNALEKMIPYKYKKDMNQNQVEKLIADMILQMKNNQPYIYVDNLNKIWYSSQTIPSKMEYKDYRHSDTKDMLDTVIKDGLKADGSSLIDFSSTMDVQNNIYVALYDTTYFMEGTKIYASTKQIYHEDKIYKWRVSYVDRENKRIFDNYQHDVKIIK